MKLLVFLLFTERIVFIFGQLLEISNSSIEQGDMFTVSCSVATINKAITFKVENEAVGSCSPPFGTLVTCDNPDIQQNLSSGITSWTISSAQVSHNGYWTCSLDVVPSPQVQLIIYKLPTTVLTSSGIISNAVVNNTVSYTVNIEVGCLFSGNGPRINLQFMKATIPKATILMTCTNSSTVCSTCTGCSAYDCNHNITLDDLKSGDIDKNVEYTLQTEVGVLGTTNSYTSPLFPGFTVTFIRQHTTKVEIFAITTKEQTYTVENPSTSTFDFQTTTEKHVSGTSMYETSEVTKSTQTLFVNRSEYNEDYIYLVVIPVLSSAGGVIVVLTIVVTVVYRCGRLPIFNKQNKSVTKLPDLEGKRKNNNAGVKHKQTTLSTRNENGNTKKEKTSGNNKKYNKNEHTARKRIEDKPDSFKTENEFHFYTGQMDRNIKRENTSYIDKKYNKNEHTAGKRIEDNPGISKTEHEFQFYTGQMDRKRHEFELTEMVDTQRSIRRTVLNETRAFNKTIPVSNQKKQYQRQSHL